MTGVQTCALPISSDFKKTTQDILINQVKSLGLGNALSHWKYWIMGNMVVRDKTTLTGGVTEAKEGYVMNQTKIVEWKHSDGADPYTSEIMLVDGYTHPPIQTKSIAVRSQRFN